MTSDSSVQFSHWVVSDSLCPHGLSCTGFLCPSPTPGACSNSCPLSWWCKYEKYETMLVWKLYEKTLDKLFISLNFRIFYKIHFIKRTWQQIFIYLFFKRGVEGQVWKCHISFSCIIHWPSQWLQRKWKCSVVVHPDRKHILSSLPVSLEVKTSSQSAGSPGKKPLLPTGFWCSSQWSNDSPKYSQFTMWENASKAHNSSSQ